LLFLKLLTSPDHNPKTAKALARGYANFIMMLAPGKKSGYEVCPDRSPSCDELCLYNQGRGQAQQTKDARIRRTVKYFEDRPGFLTLLVYEITLAVAWAQANGLIPVLRPNGLSDIAWEYVRVTVNGIEYPNLMAAFPTLQLYDYTKSERRIMAWINGELPPNYYLLFSRDETNDDVVAKVLGRANVAFVFDRVPDEYWVDGHGWVKVIDGDHDDLRFLDPLGVIVGLVPKGSARKDTSGFVIRQPLAAAV
jgi:hypothetical protein